MSLKRQSIKKNVLIGLLVFGIIFLFLVLDQSKENEAWVNFPFEPLEFRQPAVWNYSDISPPYGANPYPTRYDHPAGWINLGGSGIYVDPTDPPGPPGGQYVQEEGELPESIHIIKFYDTETWKTMDGFIVKSISFKIKTKGEFRFNLRLSGGAEFFDFEHKKLDNALLDGNWQVVEKDINLPSGDSDYQEEDYEYKAFDFLYVFKGENEFRIDDIIITSDEGVQFVIEDFEYDDVIGNHEWQFYDYYDEDYFNPLIPVYDEELGSRVFVCNDSYRKKGPGEWVYKVDDKTYPVNRLTNGIAYQYITTTGSSAYSNTGIYRTGSWNYGYQTPAYPYPFNSANSYPYSYGLGSAAFGYQTPAYPYTYNSANSYPYSYGLSRTNFGYQYPAIGFSSNPYGFANQPYAYNNTSGLFSQPYGYNFNAVPFNSYGSGFYPSANFGYGYGSGFGASPYAPPWGVGYPGGFPGFGGGWY
ncbi:hypothetical protein JXL19_08845 [bacterium]|nr:hypothetical protein [bacterium]